MIPKGILTCRSRFVTLSSCERGKTCYHKVVPVARYLSLIHIFLCGGIGAGAKEALAQAGIRLYGGVQGSADDAVQALIGGTLSYDPDVHCQGHGTHENHTCNHHCGEDKGGAARAMPPSSNPIGNGENRS